MKILANQNNGAKSGRAARDVLETVPHIMRDLRQVMRSHRTPDLSVPQFRTLGFLLHNEGASLTDLAEHIGLQPPTMSKMIDAMVSRGLVERNLAQEDRRRVTLALSPAGRQLWQEARRGTSEFVKEKLAGLPDEDLDIISRSMEILRPLFVKNRSAGRGETE